MTATLPLAQTFPLAQVAETHWVTEGGHVGGRPVLLVD
jgi:hypothetical protein